METAAVAASLEHRDALVVSALFLRTEFGGTSATYSLWLSQPCTSVVVVHLLLPTDAVSSVRLSSDRICFTPDNFSSPQLVRVDALENHTQWNVITHRLFSLDRNYDRAMTPNVVVQVEATPIECPLLTFGGLMTKRKAAAMGSQIATRLDLQAALPEETSNDASDAAPQDASWCVSHMACGYHFSVVAVSQPKGSTLLSWGLNSNGELGNGTMTSASTPQPVIMFPMQFQREPLTVSHVSCGKHHTAVITSQARLFTWGSNKFGQLGLGDFTPRTQPEEVHFALATLSSHRRALRVMHTVQRGGNNVTHVACGAAHTLFVTHQQQILGMGYNQAGQLGLGHRLQQHKGWRSCTPIAVESLRDQSILDLAAGQNHSACVISNGDVYTWGCGDDGRLGHSMLHEGATTPTLISLLKKASVRARAVRCGARHMAILSDTDLLYIWGANDFGQLGCRDKKPRSRPFLLATPPLFAEGVADVALGEFHTTCVTSTGQAHAWGLDLRIDSALVGSHDSPQMIDLPDKEQVRKISCGWTHTNIITHVTPDEASASGQGTTFDRKIERERLLQRKIEMTRWRAFISAAVTPLCHEVKHESRLEGSSRNRKIADDCQAIRTYQSDIFEQTESLLESEHSLEKFVVAYVGQGVNDAKESMARWLRTTRKNINRKTGTKQQSGCSLERQSHLKGIFYRNQLCPPELPVATGLSPTWTPPHRKLWSAPVSSTTKDSSCCECSPVSLPGTFQPKPPRTGVSSKPDKAENAMSVPERCKSDASEADSAFVVLESVRSSTSKFYARTPSLKRPTIPSPRSQATVVEALMHRPSYSITKGALASARSRQLR